MILADYCKGLLDVLIPPACLACGKKRQEKSALCSDCLKFKHNPAPYCLKCGITAYAGLKDGLCQRCRRTRFHFTRNLSPFLFDPPLSRVIHLFKYGGFDWLGRILSDKLIEFIKAIDLSLSDYDSVTFVPLHKVKLKEREYNQSRILAESISAHFGLEILDALAVKEYRASQSKQDYQQRKINVSGNYFVNSDVAGKNIILVDDVFTTGATASECAKVLKEKGAKDILSLTLSIRNLAAKDNENNT